MPSENTSTPKTSFQKPWSNHNWNRLDEKTTTLTPNRAGSRPFKIASTLLCSNADYLATATEWTCKVDKTPLVFFSFNLIRKRSGNKLTMFEKKCFIKCCNQELIFWKASTQPVGFWMKRMCEGGKDENERWLETSLTVCLWFTWTLWGIRVKNVSKIAHAICSAQKSSSQFRNAETSQLEIYNVMHWRGTSTFSQTCMRFLG